MKTQYTNISDIRQQIRQHPMLDEQSTLDLLTTLSCKLANKYDNQFLDSQLAKTLSDLLDDAIGHLETEMHAQDDVRFSEWADSREKAYGRFA